MENPLRTRFQLYIQSKITANRSHFYRYLDEMNKAKTIILVPKLNRYVAFPMSKLHSDVVAIELGRLILPKPTEEFWPKHYELITDELPLSVRLGKKLHCIYSLNSKMFDSEMKQLSKLQQTQSVSLLEAFERSFSDFASLTRRYQNFLEGNRKDTSQLESELDQIYWADIEYVGVLIKGAHSFKDVLDVSAIYELEDIQEASKAHLQKRRATRTHGRKTPENRKRPKKLTNTKKMLEKIYTDGLPDADKITYEYLSNMKRVGTRNVPFEYVKAQLAMALLSRWVKEAKDTPKNKKIKKEITKKLEKVKKLYGI